MELSGHKIFITGGTSGIGLELAKRFLDLDNIVIVCGRRQKKLNNLRRKYPKLKTVLCDIGDEDDVDRAFDYISKKFGGINILVNNAGVQFVDDFAKGINQKEVDATINTNFSSMVKITDKFLPMILEKENPVIINLSSAVAFMPIPKVAIYSATKSAIASYSRSLRFQLKKKGVNVFTVYPPKVHTKLNKFHSGGKGISPKIMARSIVWCMSWNRYEIRTGLSKLLYFGSRFFPRITEKFMQGF